MNILCFSAMEYFMPSSVWKPGGNPSGGFHSHGGTPIAGWMVDFMENPHLKLGLMI